MKIAARVATARDDAAINMDLARIKKRAPRTGPSGYNEETYCLERPARAETDAANAGEARARLQERRVRSERTRVAKHTDCVGRARCVTDTAEAHRPRAIGAKAVVADALAR